ncbi:MAG: GTP-binding protein, partial [Methanimicrococcus sp.]|nr:GTP-binding protein [Methanimicrococcus sp.]
DVPGLVKGAASGRGRGKEVMAVIRSSDLVLFLLDVFQPLHLPVLRDELYEAGIRIDQEPPDVVIKKTDRGGVRISSTVELDLDDDTIKSILDEYKIHNATVLFRDNVTMDQFIDVVAQNRSYVTSMCVVNKIDLAFPKTLEECKSV